MDTWIDLGSTVRRLVAEDAFVLLTDSAVGQEEEENLQHLASNLAGEVDPWRLVPFLTCLHSLDYCRRYAARARALGVDALTVVGGDAGSGVKRCLPRSSLLRADLRGGGGAVGGWVNPNRPAEEQAAHVRGHGFCADYYLTQIVSHHRPTQVEDWLSQGIDLPGSLGVFYYRNARRTVLEKLARFFPVPVDEVARALGSGISPERHCAQTIAFLRSAGVNHVYVCNLGARLAHVRFKRIREEVEALTR
ncbi:MAG: hypothetical protein J4G03_04265 [Gemmatimonadetes bacterium]|nr:hypothetical protein [Gemmatimonadota bacterium]